MERSKMSTEITEAQREMLTEEERGLVDQGYRGDPVFFFARKLVEARAAKKRMQGMCRRLAERGLAHQQEAFDVGMERDEAQEKLEASESARETLAELHESIASQLTTAGYVTPTPVAVEQVLTMLDEVRKWRDLPPIERLFGELNYILRKDK